MTNGANAALAAWFGAQNCYLDIAAMRPVAMTILPTQELAAGSVLADAQRVQKKAPELPPGA